ncbi:MAG: DUF2306 domain-containing protein [Gemmatimonadaceae bacterium]
MRLNHLAGKQMRMAGHVASSWRRTVVSSVLVLSVVALLAAAGRTAAVTSMLAIPPADRPKWSGLDRFLIERLTPVLGIRPGTARYEEMLAPMRVLADKFLTHWPAGLLHLIPGMIFVLLVPLQFSERIRSRRPRLHRWSGRALVIIALVIGLSGMYFGVLYPTYGLAEAVTIAVFGFVFLFSVTRAVVEIRRRNVALHREWMIRAYAAALAIATIRIVATPIIAILVDPKTSTIAAFWVGWLSTLGGAELWIRYTRGKAQSTGLAVSVPALRAQVAD